SEFRQEYLRTADRHWTFTVSDWTAGTSGLRSGGGYENGFLDRYGCEWEYGGGAGSFERYNAGVSVTGILYLDASGYIGLKMAIGNVSIQVQTSGGANTLGVILASGDGVFFPGVLYRYANLTLPYSPNDPGLTYTYDNSTLVPVVLLYARFFNLLN